MPGPGTGELGGNCGSNDSVITTQDPVRRHRDLAYASLHKSYLADAVREFEEVHRLDPADDQAILQLGSLYNMLKLDSTALQWFKLVRRSRDPKIATQAQQAIRN